MAVALFEMYLTGKAPPPAIALYSQPIPIPPRQRTGKEN
jgi:hypothetical protein